jgi:hypothetical protein
MARAAGCWKGPILLLVVTMLSSNLFAQCAARVWDSHGRDATVHSKHLETFQSVVPAGMKPRFEAQMSDSDWLVVYEKHGARSTSDPQEGGFVIVRDRKVLVHQDLLAIPAWRKFAKDVGEADRPAFAVSIAQVCRGSERMTFAAFAACCTTASAVLYMVATPERDSYRVEALPLVGGGKLEVSAGSAVKIRLWDETGDGKCDGCPQHFKVTEYRVDGGKPIVVGEETPSQLFSPGDFDAHRIVLLPAGR